MAAGSYKHLVEHLLVDGALLAVHETICKLKVFERHVLAAAKSHWLMAVLPGLQECSRGLKSVLDVSLSLLIVYQPAGKQLLSASCLFVWKASFCIISLSLGQFWFLITGRFSCLISLLWLSRLRFLQLLHTTVFLDHAKQLLPMPSGYLL